MEKIKLAIKKENAFTIIEMVVVMTIFLFIIGAAVGIFISVIQTQKKVLAEQQLINQISYAEEHMSKALRMAAKDDSGACLGFIYTGYSYLLTKALISCESSDPQCGFYRGIKFINGSGLDGDNCYEFYLDSGVLYESIKTGASPVALTSSNITINYIKFGIDGQPGINGNPIGDQGADYIQPKITILMSVSVAGQAAKIIQTTISQRNLNVQ